MLNQQFVAYFRVSTQQQGRSGLGLEAQQQAVIAYLNGKPLLNIYTEVETGKGCDALDRRPQLKAAIDLCKKRQAILIIAKLDRLARNVHFVSGLIESGIEFVCADMPQANKVMLQMYSVMAEWERDQISLRTKQALAAAKMRGVVLGKAGSMNLKPNIEQRQQSANEFALKLSQVIKDMQGRVISQRAMCDELNNLGIKTAKGGKWSLIQLQRVLKRINAI